MERLKNIIDAQHNSYAIDHQIGEGAQGKIFLLQDGRHIAKLFTNRRRLTTVESDINYLIRLGLDKRHYAVPLREVVSPASGYIAEFASGMIPLSSLKWTMQEEDFVEWYKATGGTMKRYRVLSRLAYILRSLHAKGLTYCDLSPNNIFVSSLPDNAEVFLIDMDNVRHRTGITHNIYTPFYGAPEIVTNTDCNTPFSDSFSFAVIAYELLTASHPLIGDYVDEDAEREEPALAGRIPWVEDPVDTINARSTGIPSSTFIAGQLMNLFHRTFEEGLNDPMKRPDMFEWYEAIEQSLDGMLTCPDCGMVYPYYNTRSCTICGRKAENVFHVSMRRWDETGRYDSSGNPIFGVDDDICDDIVFDESSEKTVTTAHFLKSTGETPQEILKVVIKEMKGSIPKVTISPLDGTVFRLYLRSGLPHSSYPTIYKPVNISINPANSKENRLMLTLDNLGQEPCRVLMFD